MIRAKTLLAVHYLNDMKVKAAEVFDEALEEGIDEPCDHLEERGEWWRMLHEEWRPHEQNHMDGKRKTFGRLLAPAVDEEEVAVYKRDDDCAVLVAWVDGELRKVVLK